MKNEGLSIDMQVKLHQAAIIKHLEKEKVSHETIKRVFYHLEGIKRALK